MRNTIAMIIIIVCMITFFVGFYLTLTVTHHTVGVWLMGSIALIGCVYILVDAFRHKV